MQHGVWPVFQLWLGLKKVYPESEDALSDLWNAVLKISRVDEKGCQ